jgi:PncC family amidohydrolase
MQNLRQIKELINKKNETLAVAESLTSGNLQAMIWSILGASTFFKGWITTYQEESKVKILGVDQKHAHSVNCVSQRVADEMAIWACSLFQSDRTISTTWYAEAWGEFLVPFAYYAIAHSGWEEIKIVSGWRIDGESSMSRVEMQKFVSTEVLERFVEKL